MRVALCSLQGFLFVCLFFKVVFFKEKEKGKKVLTHENTVSETVGGGETRSDIWAYLAGGGPAVSHVWGVLFPGRGRETNHGNRHIFGY